MYSLFQLLDFDEYCVRFLFIFKRLDNPGVVQQFFEDRVYYSLANLRANSAECLPRLLRFLFSNDVDIKVAVDPPLDDF